MWRCGRKDKKNPPVLHASMPREATLLGFVQREPAGIPSVITVVPVLSQFQLSLSTKPRKSLEGTPPLRLWSLRDRQALRRERVGKWLGNGGTQNAFDARSSRPALLREDEKRWKVLLARKVLDSDSARLGYGRVLARRGGRVDMMHAREGAKPAPPELIEEQESLCLKSRPSESARSTRAGRTLPQLF